MAVAPFRQQSHVEEVIVRTEERPLSTVTAWRDVVWQGGDDGAGHASHGDRVPSIPRMQFGRVTYWTGESRTHASWHAVALVSPDLPICEPGKPARLDKIGHLAIIMTLIWQRNWAMMLMDLKGCNGGGPSGPPPVIIDFPLPIPIVP